MYEFNESSQSSQSQPGTQATCSICHLRVKVIKSNGTLRRHGYGQGNLCCTGSLKPPEITTNYANGNSSQSQPARERPSSQSQPARTRTSRRANQPGQEHLLRVNQPGQDHLYSHIRSQSLRRDRVRGLSSTFPRAPGLRPLTHWRKYYWSFPKNLMTFLSGNCCSILHNKASLNQLEAAGGII